METLIVEDLQRSAIATAFPLVHLMTPGLDLHAWRRFAVATLDHRRGALAGILIARRDTRRHFSGLVCYRRELDLVEGFVMNARHLIGVDILDAKPVVSALMRSVALIARSGNCPKIRLMVPTGRNCRLITSNFIALTRRYPNVNYGLDILVATEDVLAASHDLMMAEWHRLRDFGMDGPAWRLKGL